MRGAGNRSSKNPLYDSAVRSRLKPADKFSVHCPLHISSPDSFEEHLIPNQIRALRNVKVLATNLWRKTVFYPICSHNRGKME